MFGVVVLENQGERTRKFLIRDPDSKSTTAFDGVLRRERHAGDQDSGPVAAGRFIRGAVRGHASPRVPGSHADPR